MSGGHFEYHQYRLTDIYEEIQLQINKSGRPKSKKQLDEENWHDPDWFKKYPEDLNHYAYPKEVLAEFEKAVKIIKEAQVYIQRIDYLLSGDDGEESFLERLKIELEKL